MDVSDRKALRKRTINEQDRRLSKKNKIDETLGSHHAKEFEHFYENCYKNLKWIGKYSRFRYLFRIHQ